MAYLRITHCLRKCIVLLRWQSLFHNQPRLLDKQRPLYHHNHFYPSKITRSIAWQNRMIYVTYSRLLMAFVCLPPHISHSSLYVYLYISCKQNCKRSVPHTIDILIRYQNTQIINR